MKLFTIGFTQKRAEEFFGLLRLNGVGKLMDIRLNPGGQLSGFAKQEDLPYFLRELAAGCEYVHIPELAPTKEILKDYRNDNDWLRYVDRFGHLMDERNIPASLNRAMFEQTPCCLLCSEATPEQCHRRLVAERLAAHWPITEIIHL
ncbi:MAG: DUF488 domain-containing protein [Chloroflexi bacterium]|nr:DUF488 domain-containing protein [Chloroflexota bacterium]